MLKWMLKNQNTNFNLLFLKLLFSISYFDEWSKRKTKVWKYGKMLCDKFNCQKHSRASFTFADRLADKWKIKNTSSFESFPSVV